jgi:hypothetical protein
MKIGTKVRVVTCIYGHDFQDGQIVKRFPLEYDNDHKDLVGFIGENGQTWYMAPDEYEEYEQ